MQKLFEFVEHIGKYRVLVQTRDIQNGAVTTAKIVDNAVTTDKIGDGEVKSRNIEGGAVTTEKIGDGEVKTVNIGAGAVTPEKLDGTVMTIVIQPSIDAAISELDAEHKKILEFLQHEIEGLNDHGVSVSQEFGDNSHIGISQKTLTDAINRIWEKIGDMTGELTQGIRMTVDPDYFISENGCDVHITATTEEANGVFEKIAFYIDNSEEPFAEAENVDVFSHDIHIDDTCLIRCVAKIMGVEYSKQKRITHYNSFWLGAGNTYTDVMKPANLIPIENGMRGAYDVAVGAGQKIIVVVGGELTGYIRMDMNGFEIPTTKQVVDVNGDQYTVYTSVNSYMAGTYNIDVNG